jgi:diadenosine tetraphosphatase ApaH/serine/threonine PP2A family protein phosphatase
MRIAVLSDIHANLIALEAVLAQVDILAPDALWCLGDIVGYGPEPQACADLIHERASVCLAGNHDLAVVGKIPLEHFNDVAAQAATWQRERLRPETIEWLGALPSRQEVNEITLVHASPRDPIWEYIADDRIAGANAEHFETQLCLMGHSHRAVGWRLRETGWWGRVKMVSLPANESLHLAEDARWLLNPGSVGQPRDADPRASFAILDLDADIWATETWTWHRVEYDIDAAEAAITAAGLPEVLGRRLHLGW